jgi:hypothetical protein
MLVVLAIDRERSLHAERAAVRLTRHWPIEMDWPSSKRPRTVLLNARVNGWRPKCVHAHRGRDRGGGRGRRVVRAVEDFL